MVQLSHPYMITGKTIALTRWTFVVKVLSLLFNMLSSFVITFLPRSKHLLISWLQSPSAVILKPKKIKSLTIAIVSPTICHEVMGPDAMILVFWFCFCFFDLSFLNVQFSVQLHSHVWLFATPWTAACQATPSINNFWSLLKLMSIESVMPSKHLILCRPLLLPFSIFPSIRSFQMSQFFTSGGQNIGVSASATFFPMNIQDCFPLGWTGWISLQSKGLSRVFSNITAQKHQFFGAQLSP